LTPEFETVPLARPDLGEREERLVLDVLRSGRLSLGPMLERFEHEFAAWLGVEDAVAVSSGTAALHLGVRGLGWGRGDEVVTSPFSFVASANCLLYEDVRPVFCDVDPETLNLDPAAVSDAVGVRTAGVLPVHIFGWPAKIEELERIAADRGLGLLEDACEALGAVYADGVRVGARGNAATFAFYANKQLVTGEGGMLIPADRAAAERARGERNQGRAEDMSELAHARLGFNYRLTDVAAALGVAQLERLDEILAARARVARLYGERLEQIEGLVLPLADHPPERRGWFVYVVQLPVDADRAEVIVELAERGVESKPYLPCIHLLPFYRDRFGHREGEFPVAERVSMRSLGLPFHSRLGEAEIDRVCTALAAALRRRVPA
jgi:perosamine synthetase